MIEYDFTAEFSSELQADLKRQRDRGVALEQKILAGSDLPKVIQDCLVIVTDETEQVLWRLHAVYVASLGAIKLDEPAIVAYLRDVLAHGLTDPNEEEHGLANTASVLDDSRRASLLARLDKYIAASPLADEVAHYAEAERRAAADRDNEEAGDMTTGSVNTLDIPTSQPEPTDNKASD